MIPVTWAKGPIWTFTPLSQTTLTVPVNGNASVQYLVRNHSSKAKRLVMIPIPGIQASPCQLAPREQAGSSCTLNLSINGSALPANGIHGGPKLCQANPDGSPNPLQCYQPSQAFSLQITKGSIQRASLAVAPPILNLVASSGVPGYLTITNTSSTVTAQNIRATLPPSWTDVTQDASDCLLLAPNASCQLQFTPGATPHAAETIPITGNNTTQVTAIIAVSPQPIATLAVLNSPLALAVSGAARSLIIENTSLTVTAINITADFSGTALDGNMTESGNTCAVVLPGATCTITFTPGASSVPLTSFPIQGSNTTATTAAIVIGLAIGDTWQGGFIFELNADGVSGKTVATTDNSTDIFWGGGVLAGVGPAAQSPTNGPGNTTAIVNFLSAPPYNLPLTDFAAGICAIYSVVDGGITYDDWYLPARSEILTLWQQTNLNGGPIPGFAFDGYWSSTEDSFSTTSAWAQNANGTQNAYLKNVSPPGLRVRCIRVFS